MATTTADRASKVEPNPPTITQSVAIVFAVFGLLASLSMGWILARSMAGLPPFMVPVRVAAPASPAAATQSLHVTATDFKFDNPSLQLAGPGEVKVELENKGLIDHDLTFESVRFTLFAKPGKTSSGTLKIDKPGTYTFFCSQPGHREAGMVGKLVVGNGSAAPAANAPAANAAAKASDTHDMSGMNMDVAAAATAAAGQHVSHATTATPQTKGNQLLSPVMDGAVKTFSLTAQVVQWEVIPGVREEAWTYNGQMPGPMIRVTEGDQVRITLKNELPEPTILHLHGLDTPNDEDGVPDVTQPVIPVGGSFAYNFTAEPAGTYIYHTHHNSAVQEPKGLYGVLIVDPKPGSAEALRDAHYTRDYVQVLSEFSGYFTINGHSFPATDVMEAKVGETVRIRLFNIGQTPHPMHLHGFHFKVVGMDGIPVTGPPQVKDTSFIAPGERYDLEVTPDRSGLWVFHCHILSHVTNQGVEPGGMLAVLKVTA